MNVKFRVHLSRAVLFFAFKWQHPGYFNTPSCMPLWGNTLRLGFTSQYGLKLATPYTGYFLSAGVKQQGGGEFVSIRALPVLRITLLETQPSKFSRDGSHGSVGPFPHSDQHYHWWKTEMALCGNGRGEREGAKSSNGLLNTIECKGSRWQKQHTMWLAQDQSLNP